MSAAGLDQTDPTFVDDLRASQTAVWKVAAWLQARGNNVVVRALRIRPSAESYPEYADAGDLELIQRVEVSRRSCMFSCAEDYPFDAVLVDAVHKCDRAVPKPFAYVIVNRDETAVAVVYGRTRVHWTERTIFNSKTNRGDRRVYFCPLEHVLFYPLQEARG